MELNDNINIKNLTQSLNFKSVSTNQTSFLSELDFSLSASKSVNDASLKANETQPIEAKKEEPIVKTKEETSEPQKTEDNKQVNNAEESQEPKKTDDSKKTEAKKSDSDDAALDSKDGVALNQTEKPTQNIENDLSSAEEVTSDLDDMLQTQTTENANVDEMASKADGSEVSEIKTTEYKSLEDKGGEESAQTSQTSGAQITTANQVVAEVAVSKNSEVVYQEAPVELTQDTIEVEAETQTPKLGDYVATNAAASADDDTSVEVLTPLEAQEVVENLDVIKSPELKAQERELAEKLPTDSKLNVEVNVEEEDFDFSKPQIIVKEDVVAESKAEAIQATSATKETPKQQNLNLEVAKPVAAMQNNTVIVDAEFSSKVSSDNVNPIGFEATKSVKTAHNTVEVKTNSNDNLKGLSKEVIDQVKVNITKSAVKGVDVIDVSLKPEELGKLNIKMEINKETGVLDVHIAASSKEALEILQKDIQSLQKSFEEAGFKLTDESFSFSHQQEGQENNNKQARIDFMADALSANTEVEEIIYDGNNALNIKV